MDINQLLTLAVQHNASDLHLSTGLPPRLRVDGELADVTEVDVLTHDLLTQMLHTIMDERCRKEFDDRWETDFAYGLPNLARFRVNVFKQNRGIAAAFRTIPSKIFTLDELGMPPILKELTMLPRGLVLVTGPTGSGKSTTLASMIDYINERKHEHILTVEDPIEYVHKSKWCLVNQREVHRDTKSFNAALRSALREDPDIILVGEMRDLETIRLALTAAETGHLVFATLHTVSAAKTINRMIDVFPGEEKSLIRTMLSESLQAVLSQLLLKRVAKGRIAAHEIMVCTPAIRNLIREDKVAQMYSMIQTGSSKGMKTLDQHLQSLVSSRTVDKSAAQEVAQDKSTFTT